MLFNNNILNLRLGRYLRRFFSFVAYKWPQ
jgi:hypothetical protein